MTARKGAGRYIEFKYAVTLLNKDNKNKDQSKEEHEAVLENHKGKKIRKERSWVYVHASIRALNRMQATASGMLGIIKLLQFTNVRYLEVCWFAFFL